MNRLRPAAWLVAACVALAAVPAARGQSSAPYVLGVEDEIAVSVWLHPELERTVAVQSSGNIVFPPLGAVPAAGLTADELGARLADRLSTYLRQPTTVTVTVSRYLARSVFVTGAVNTPGRYGFETLPELREVLNAAGGVVPGADLTRVQVSRKGQPTLTVDVLNAQRAGTTDDLPDLQPGDVVFVASFAGAFAPAPGDGFAVLGSVRTPGVYQAGPRTNAWMALAQAGGLTPEGDLSKVRIVSITADGQQVALVNLKDVLRRGGASAPIVRPGDIVFVPNTTASIAAKGWTALTQALALTRDLVNIVIIADYLDKR
jgi:protein involved in polysaccharide export with SLBB domain